MSLGRLRRECTTVTIDYVEGIRFDYHCYVYSALVCTGGCMYSLYYSPQMSLSQSPMWLTVDVDVEIRALIYYVHSRLSMCIHS